MIYLWVTAQTQKPVQARLVGLITIKWTMELNSNVIIFEKRCHIYWWDLEESRDPYIPKPKNSVQLKEKNRPGSVSKAKNSTIIKKKKITKNFKLVPQACTQRHSYTNENLIIKMYFFVPQTGVHQISFKIEISD